MTVAPGPDDLTTVAAVQAYLPDSASANTDLLQSLVTAASAFMQSVIGYQIAPASYTETRSGNGRDRMILANTPLISVQSLSVDDNPQVPSPGWGQTGYLFDASAIYLTGWCFNRGCRNISISYTAGYPTVPADLAQACNELVALRFKERTRVGFVSSTLDGQTTAYVQKDMPASVSTVLAQYKRRFVPQ